MKRTLKIEVNKNGRKRIQIGNFIIIFDENICTGHQYLGILKDAEGLPNLKVMGKNDKPALKDWMIHIYETDDDPCV